jgi:glutamate-ammonia-ligase adenylyltransferase
VLAAGRHDDEVAGVGRGFGKFGGIELGYGSDLDLVFLYDAIDGNALTNGDKPISCTQFYGRQ